MLDPYADKEELPTWFKTLGCLALIVMVGLPVLFGLLITGIFWVIFSLLYQLVEVSWPMWIFFLVVQVLVKNNKMLVMAGMRWWTVSAAFVHAAIIIGLFNEPFHSINLGHGKPSSFDTWWQLLLGALLALPIGTIAYCAKRCYHRYRLKT